MDLNCLATHTGCAESALWLLCFKVKTQKIMFYFSLRLCKVRTSGKAAVDFGDGCLAAVPRFCFDDLQDVAVNDRERFPVKVKHDGLRQTNVVRVD